jgi:hypothetical protein
MQKHSQHFWTHFTKNKKNTKLKQRRAKMERSPRHDMFNYRVCNGDYVLKGGKSSYTYSLYLVIDAEKGRVIGLNMHHCDADKANFDIDQSYVTERRLKGFNNGFRISPSMVPDPIRTALWEPVSNEDRGLAVRGA